MQKFLLRKVSHKCATLVQSKVETMFDVYTLVFMTAEGLSLGPVDGHFGKTNIDHCIIS